MTVALPTLTTNHRIKTMKLYAFMTGEYVTDESAAEGEAAEMGWVDPSWSSQTFFDSRNDVRPVLDTDTDDEELEDDVKSVLGKLGAYEDNGDGTFYSQQNYHNKGWYTYAIHFFTKSYGPNGWQEKPWHPSEAGISVSS